MSRVHVVKAGDSLWSISQMYRVDLDELRLANQLEGDVIIPGQELIIPGVVVLMEEEGGFELPEGDYTPGEPEDLELLARLVFAEARGEPFDGQIAVAAVVYNRLNHASFPNTVREVIYQPRQFESVGNGTINQTPNDLAYLAVFEARSGVDPTDGAVFFWNPYKVSPSSWVWTQTVRLQIGDHVFA